MTIKEIQLNVPLGEFLKGTKEDWEEKWQNPNFTHSFPSRVQTFLSDERHYQFLKQHENTIVPLAISAFMQLPRGTRDKASIAVNNMAFTKEGKTITFLDNKDNTRAADPLIKAEIASLMLLGFNPANQQTTIQSLTSGFEELTASRKTNFKHNVFGLITKSSSVRAWIKTNNLDAKNGFVWERDVPKFALSLLSTTRKTIGRPAVRLPQELLNLEPVTPEALEPFVDYMLDFATNLSKTTGRKKTEPLFNGAAEFMIEVNRSSGHTIPQEKLDRLSNLIIVKSNTAEDEIHR